VVGETGGWFGECGVLLGILEANLFFIGVTGVLGFGRKRVFSESFRAACGQPDQITGARRFGTSAVNPGQSGT
jgi:hypothetical protein